MSSDHAFKPVRKAVFPVAGLGTRFLPATKVLPKEMLPLGDRPLIQHAYEEAREAGIEEFIFVTSPHKKMLEDHCKTNTELEKLLNARGHTDLLELVKSSDISNSKLYTIIQEEPLGLGHAVWCARELIRDEPFAVILPDDVFLAKKSCLAQMIKAYNELGGNLIAVTDVSKEDTARYGIVDLQEDSGKTVSINGLVEKPGPDKAPSQLAIMGRYILQPEIFDYLAAFEKGVGGEIQLTDAMVKLIDNQSFRGFRYEGKRYDCGTKLGFIETNIAFGLADPETGSQIRAILHNILNEKEQSNEAA